MPREQVSLATLPNFDFGRAAAAFDQALELVVKDCLDRPGLAKARKVIFEVEVEPGHSEAGEPDELIVGFQVAAKTPAKATVKRPVGVTKQGRLFFNPDAPDNPAQNTFEMDQGGD